jgi:hypothetical protein
MKTHPIIFPAVDVRAFLEGRKTQFRVPVKPQPTEWTKDRGRYWPAVPVKKDGELVCGMMKSPYNIGDRLWVKETWVKTDDEYGSPIIIYSADDTAWYLGENNKRLALCTSEWHVSDWASASSMPVWACRLFLEIVDISVQQVQDITAYDVFSEGYMPAYEGHWPKNRFGWFANKWDALYAKRGLGWDANPWVWAFTVNRVEATQL